MILYHFCDHYWLLKENSDKMHTSVNHVTFSECSRKIDKAEPASGHLKICSKQRLKARLKGHFESSSENCLLKAPI